MNRECSAIKGQARQEDARRPACHRSIDICMLGALVRLIRKLDWIQQRAGGIERSRIRKSGNRHKLESDLSGGE